MSVYMSVRSPPIDIAPPKVDRFDKVNKFLGQIKKTAEHSIQVFQSDVWPLVNETRKICKNVCNIISTTVPNLARHLKPASAALNLFAGISFLFAIKSIVSSCKEIVTSVRLGDIEGLALGILGGGMSAGDAFDSFITFQGALANLGLGPQLTVFSPVGLPLAFALLGVSTCVSTYKTIWNFVELYKMRKVTKMDNAPEMIDYFRKRIGVTKREKYEIEKKLEEKGLSGDALEEAKIKKVRDLKTLKRRVVARHHGDQRVVNIMRNLKKELKDDAITLERAKIGVRDICKITGAHGAVNAASTAVNGAMIGALVALTTQGISPLVLPLMGLGRSAFQLGKFVFLKKGIDYLITEKEFAKAKIQQPKPTD